MVSISELVLHSRQENVGNQSVQAISDSLNYRFDLESVFELLVLSCWYVGYEDYDVSCSSPLDYFKRLNYSNFFTLAAMVIIGVVTAMTKLGNSTAFDPHLECCVRNHLANFFKPSFCYSTFRDGCMALAAKVTTCRRTVSCTYSLHPAD